MLWRTHPQSSKVSGRDYYLKTGLNKVYDSHKIYDTLILSAVFLVVRKMKMRPSRTGFVYFDVINLFLLTCLSSICKNTLKPKPGQTKNGGTQRPIRLKHFLSPTAIIP
ncbi:hypothetical protein RF11_14013 [Thelohanellus kitauei]|uniref:Uncharacterized protein n=1 Tax=Thelohanellus kitauei TaxID=669202 RepID=A0A0C2MLY3_THEKT|nr:hypothetical protein RF11_14013 [Thelohanellus kitauei]